MKTFNDNFTPIEVGIKNKDGEMFELQSKFMSIETVKKIESLMADEEGLKSDMIYEMLELTFGKGEDFFKQFSVGILGEVLKYVAEETKKNSQTVDGSTS